MDFVIGHILQERDISRQDDTDVEIHSQSRALHNYKTPFRHHTSTDCSMTQTRARKEKLARDTDERLAAAMASFNLHYGRDETKLEKWKLLCDDCGVQRGGSITKCKTVSCFVLVPYPRTLLKPGSFYVQWR